MQSIYGLTIDNRAQYWESKFLEHGSKELYFKSSALVNITGMLLAYINFRGYFPLAPLTPPYDRGISTRILSA